MVRIEFSDCTYRIVRCIANEGTDEEEIIELPLLAYSDVFINGKYYSINFDDGEIEENTANFNIVITKDYIKNNVHPAKEPPYKYRIINSENGAGGSIIFDIDVDEDEFDPRKVTIYCNQSDIEDLNGLLLDYIYYDGEQIYIEEDNYEDVYQYYMTDYQWEVVEN